MIKLDNISKFFKVANKNIYAIKNINLEIKQGEFVVIMGPSGSGKSTLIHIIGGLLKPSQGNIIINKQDLTKINDIELSKFRNKNIGFVFQNFNLQSYYNALENVELPLIFSEIPKEERKEKALKILKELGLEHRIKHRPSQLSGGEIQRIAIARSIINEPNIILADEPTGNLDKTNAEKIINLLSDINNKYNITIILVTHNMLLKQYCSKFIEIEDGQIKNEK